MLQNKNFIVRAFNANFIEFLATVAALFPENTSIATAKSSSELIIKSGPTVIIRAWYENIYVPYREQVELGDFHFFLEKDYRGDIDQYGNTNSLLNTIEKLRECLIQLPAAQIENLLLYVQKLSRLSHQYSLTSLSGRAPTN